MKRLIIQTLAATALLTTTAAVLATPTKTARADTLRYVEVERSQPQICTDQHRSEQKDEYNW